MHGVSLAEFNDRLRLREIVSKLDKTGVLGPNLSCRKGASVFTSISPGKAVLSVTESMKSKPGKLSSKEHEALLGTLKERFEKNMVRHKGLEWEGVRSRLDADAAKLWSLAEMENSGGEPDVVGFDKKTGEYIFYDCSAESPKGRRSVCYDRQALDSRKENKPKDSALDMAEAIGIELLTEDQYRDLQKLGEFDLKTSSWIETPPAIRKLGGALFCDRRYDTVFLYHNGAESYYAARGFRGSLRV
jgi:hypothetical protein